MTTRAALAPPGRDSCTSATGRGQARPPPPPVAPTSCGLNAGGSVTADPPAAPTATSCTAPRGTRPAPSPSRTLWLYARRRQRGRRQPRPPPHPSLPSPLPPSRQVPPWPCTLHGAMRGWIVPRAQHSVVMTRVNHGDARHKRGAVTPLGAARGAEVGGTVEGGARAATAAAAHGGVAAGRRSTACVRASEVEAAPGTRAASADAAATMRGTALCGGAGDGGANGGEAAPPAIVAAAGGRDATGASPPIGATMRRTSAAGDGAPLPPEPGRRGDGAGVTLAATAAAWRGRRNCATRADAATARGIPAPEMRAPPPAPPPASRDSPIATLAAAPPASAGVSDTAVLQRVPRCDLLTSQVFATRRKTATGQTEGYRCAQLLKAAQILYGRLTLGRALPLRNSLRTRSIFQAPSRRVRQVYIEYYKNCAIAREYIRSTL